MVFGIYRLLFQKFPNHHPFIGKHLNKINPLRQPRHIHHRLLFRYLACDELLTADIKDGQEWTDGIKLIEDRLAEILAKFELEAQREKEQRAANAEERRIREERERIEREKWERQEKEKADFDDLLNQANQWQQAMILYNHIAAVEDKAGHTQRK